MVCVRVTIHLQTNNHFIERRRKMTTIEELMRGCLKAMEDGKNSQAADYFSDDGVFVTPFGKFAGKEQIKKFLNWQNSQMSWTAEKAGNDIILLPAIISCNLVVVVCLPQPSNPSITYNSIQNHSFLFF